MLFNAKIENPLLIGAIEMMKASENPEKKEAVLEEIIKATFLCPATVSQPPLIGEDGEPYLPDECEIQQKMVQDAKGRPLLLAFTSQEEMDKWMSQRMIRDFVYGFGMSFLEYVDLMMQKLPDGSRGPAQGFVIDPYGCNLVVDRDMVANIMLRLIRRSIRISETLQEAQAATQEAKE